jgi:hypothetical protein
MSSDNRLNKLRNRKGIPPWIAGAGIVLVLLAAYWIFFLQRMPPGNILASITPPSPGLRVLAAPVSQQQGSVTLTIVQAIADGGHTLLIYRVAGLGDNMAAAAGDRQPDPALRLADGMPVALRSGAQDSLNGGYFEYAPLPAAATDVVFEMARLPLVRAGAAPENWRVTLHLAANPDQALQVPSGQSATSAPFSPASNLAALIVRVQQLVQKGYGEFSGKAGWIHMIDENYSAGPASANLRIETWYEVNAAGLVTRYVTWQRTPDGTLVQSSAAKAQTSYDFTAKKSYPYLPAVLKFDWGLLRSLEEDALQPGTQVKSEDALCVGQPCLKVTLVQAGPASPAAKGSTPAAPRTETEFQLSLATGRILQSQTTYFRADGSQTISGGRPVSIERADAPPAAVLNALQAPAFP